jgi:mannosyltransferase
LTTCRVPPVWLIPLLALTLLAFGLRAWRLDVQALWWDEGISLYLANQDVATILADRARDIHPPLYFLLLRAWGLSVGSSAWATRFLSVLLGTLCVPLLYRLGRRLAGPLTGGLAALILALSPFLLHHAQEVRMYALVPLLALLSTYLMLRLLQQEEFFLWLVYLVVTAVALYTHYYAAFIPFFQTIFVLIARRRKFLLRWLMAQAGLLLLYLPWLAFVGSKLLASVAGKTRYEQDISLGLFPFLDRYLRTASIGYLDRSALTSLGAYALFLLLAFLGIYRWWGKARRPGLALVLLYVGLPLLGGWLINLRFPFDRFPRLLAFAAPAYYLLVAGGLVWRHSPILGGVALLSVIGISISGLVPYYTILRQPDEDYRPLIARVEGLARPEDAVICDFPWQAGYFQSYYQGDWPRLYLPPGQAWASEPSRMGQDLDRLMADYRLVWYPAYQGLGGTRGRNIEGYLSQEYYLALDEWYGRTRLLLYAGPRSPREMGHRLEVDLGDRIRLLGYSLGRETVPVGDVLPLTLHWQALAGIEERYKVFFHLLDAHEQVVAQRDAEPGGGARPTTTWEVGDALADHYGVLIPPDTTLGEYWIEVGMYNPVTGARLPVSVKGHPTGDRVLLGSIRVIASEY